MAEWMTIGELARAASVPVSTLRYYERTGLLRPAARSASRYRLYTSEELARLRFIRAAQARGFALADVRVLLRRAPCRRVRALVETRLEDVERRMAELRAWRRTLREARRLCGDPEESGRCGAVDFIARSAALRPAERRPS